MCAAGVNTAKSDEVCQQEGRAIVAAYEQRAASWWSLDPSSSWLSMRHLKALLDSEWQAGSCRGPGMQAPARKALEARSQALIKDMSIARLQFVDGSLVGVYAICLLGLVNCGSRLCEGARFEDSHKEAKRRSQQMCCSCVLALLLLQALVLAIILAILAPHALWRVQLSRQLPSLKIDLNEPDDDSVPILHVVLANVLLIQLAMACDTCCRAKRLRAKANNDRYNV
jgi:hypothetical protein